MSNTYAGGSITAFAVGSTQTTGAASARIAIPANSAAENPRYIRVAAINETYVKLGSSTVTATTNDVLIQPADAAVFAVNGATHIAYIQGTAAGKVNVIPLENM